MIRCRIVAAVFGMFVLAVEARAQTVEVSDVESPSHTSSIFARIGYGRRNDTNIDGPDQIATDDARGEAGGTIVFNDRIRWLNAVGYGFTHYSSEYANAHVHNLTFASILGIGVNESVDVLVGPLLSFSADYGVNWGDAYSVGALAGATYTPSDDLSLGMALAFTSQIEEGMNVLPVPMVDWRFAPGWRLHTGVTEVAARRGVGGFVEWNVVGPCDLSVGAQFEHRRFRLDEVTSFSPPGGKAGHNFVGEDESVPVYLRANVRLIGGLSADFLAGVAFGGKITISDSDDHYLSDAEYDPTAIIGVRVQYAFNDF